MTTAFRSPQAFVQFISDTVTNVSPQYLVGISTSKTLQSPAGSFEVMLKTSELPQSARHAPRRSTQTIGSVDYWFENIRPMTLAIISLGASNKVTTVQTVLSQGRGEGEGLASLGATPTEAFKTAGPRGQEAVLETVVMVGLVESVSLSTMMTETGPQRVVTVAGRDFGKLLMDDMLRRILRSADAQGVDHQLINVGAVDADVADRIIQRATIQVDDPFWAKVPSQGLAYKQRLGDVLDAVLDKAPGVQLKLQNGQWASDYFNTVTVDDELAPLYVRGIMTLFWFNGPIWEALAQLVPSPLAEMFVDTVGFGNQLIARRAPFYRPATMPFYADAVRSFLNIASYDQIPADGVLSYLRPFLEKDAFTTKPLRIPSATEDRQYHIVTQADVIGVAMARQGTAAISQYQVVPAILMLGKSTEMGASLGLTGAYLYDLATAARFGTNLMQAVCPWDIVGGEGRVDPTKATDQSLSTQQLAGVETVDEMALSASETVRLYYYFRDNPEMLSGSLTIRGRPEIRIGDRIHLPDMGDIIVYIDTVAHAYRFGQPFVTQVNFSRGQPFAPTRRLAGWDANEPTIGLSRSSQTTAAPSR